MAAVIRIEVQGSDGGVQEVKQDVRDLSNEAEDAGKKFSAMGEIMTGALRHIGTLGVDLAIKGLSAIGGAISEGIDDAKGYAIIAAQTEAVITSTGNAAGVSAQHVADYAASLSDAAGQSLFGDDQIQESTNLLLTFTNIKGTVLDASTAISVDMAQALGGAPKDSAIQLGKALNDPIKGITALTRVGVTFSEEQKAMIQAMQEAGDMAGAQQVILDELNKEFGGSAAAAAEATGGWSEFNGRMGEAKETMGAAVLPLLNMLVGVLASDVMPIVEAAAGAFAEIVGVLADAGPMSSEFGETMGYLASQLGLPGELIQDIVFTIQDLIAVFQEIGPLSSEFGETIGYLAQQLGLPGPMVDLLEDGIFALQGAIQSMMAVFSDAANPVEGFLNVLSTISPMFALVRGIIESVLPPIQSIVESVFGNIATFLHTHGDDIRAFLQQTWAQIQSIIQLALQLIQATIVPILTFIAGFIASHGAEIQSLLSNTWNAIKAVIDIALTLIQGVLKAALQIIQGDWSGAWTTIKEMCARIVQDLWTIIQAGLNNVVTLFGGLVTQVMDVLDKLPGQAAQLGKDVVNGIIDGVASMAGALLDILADMAADALQAWKDAIFSESPSKVFAEEGGKPIVTGIIAGVQSMIPNLVGVLDDVALAIISKAKKVTEKVVDEANKIQDALIEQAQGIADKLGGVMADAFTGSASLDRAKAKAIAALKDITAAQQEEVQKQLAAAAQTAGGFGDPKQAAAFFKLRSDQIFELAKIKDQIAKADTDAAALQLAANKEVDATKRKSMLDQIALLGTTKERLIEQYNLIGKAQQSELQAFDTKAGGSSPLETITQKIQELLANPNVPGILDGNGTGVIGALMQALPQLIAMSGGNNPSASSTTNSNQFTYAPTINTTGSVAPPIDHSTARALSGV